MFLHIGGSKVVKMDEIIGIFNLNLLDKSTNRQFIDSNVGLPQKGKYKSFVVTEKEVSFSPIAPLTLKKRS
jgi:hypothetical protein